MSFKTCLILVVGLAAAGCSGIETGFFPFEAVPLPARDATAEVALFRGEPDHPHHDIGEVFAQGDRLNDLEAIRAALVRTAASVGADAVKLVRIGSGWREYGTYAWGYGHFDPFYPGWGWGAGYPAYYGGISSTVMVRGIAIVWVDEKK